MSEEELTWTRLEQLGLSITHRQTPASGWGYRWRGGRWEGPYETQLAALAAALTRAIDTMILARECPFPGGDCPLLKPPSRSHWEEDIGKDEVEAGRSLRHESDPER